MKESNIKITVDHYHEQDSNTIIVFVNRCALAETGYAIAKKLAAANNQVSIIVTHYYDDYNKKSTVEELMVLE